MDWRECVSTSPQDEDFFCRWGPVSEGGNGFLEKFNLGTCAAVAGKTLTSPDGIVTCSFCLDELDIETDLEAGMVVDDAYSNPDDDDNDGNADNPEYIIADSAVSDEMQNDTPEESMERQILEQTIELGNMLTRASEFDPASVEPEDREFFEEVSNKQRYYGAWLRSNAMGITTLYMTFSKYGINALGDVTNRSDAIAAVALIYRLKEGMVFDDHEFIIQIGEDATSVGRIRERLLYAMEEKLENRIEVFINAIVRSGEEFDEGMERAVIEAWRSENPEVPRIIAPADVLAAAFVIAASRHLFGLRIAASTLAPRLGLNRNRVSSYAKDYSENHFARIKTAPS